VREEGVMAEQEVYHQLLRSAARRFTGPARRLFIAEVTDALCGGSPRRAERLFGWSRDTASLGLQESAHGLRCVDNFQARGRQRTEDLDTQLAQDIRVLAEPHTQADPQLQSALRYTRLTAAALRQALIKEKGYREEQLPSNRTLQRMLNRMGYRLKRIQKTKPVKKIKQTDAIFANIQQRHEEARQDPETLEISIDTKAKVNLGEYSREGQTRSDAAGETPPAWDHDPQAKKRGYRSES
jgi:Rhodopirellula transposase DDE domain